MRAVVEGGREGEREGGREGGVCTSLEEQLASMDVCKVLLVTLPMHWLVS